MPPPRAFYGPPMILPVAEVISLACAREYIRRRSSQLLYIADGGRMYFLPRHYAHAGVKRKRFYARRLASNRKRIAHALPREYRTLIRRRIILLRSQLLNGATLRDIALRSSMSRETISLILLGRRIPRLDVAVTVADALGVRVRTLAKYLRRIRRLRKASLQ